MKPFFAMALLLVFAGCSAPDDTGTTTDRTTSMSGPVRPELGMTGCQGFHTFFTSPAEGFQQFVPDNFTLTMSGPDTIEVPVFAFDCDNGTAEMWALLRVTPPEAYRNQSYAVDAVVLQAFTTNQTLHAEYVALGFERVVHATVQDVLYGVGPARHDLIALGDGSMRYDLRTTVHESTGPFDPTLYRYWATNSTGATPRATGWLDVATGPARGGIGPGTASFQSQGDPGAPPLAAGIGHRVHGAALQLTWHEIGGT